MMKNCFLEIFNILLKEHKICKKCEKEIRKLDRKEKRRIKGYVFIDIK